MVLQPVHDPQENLHCGGAGYHVITGTVPACCGNVGSGGECRGDCAVPEQIQEQQPCHCDNGKVPVELLSCPWCGNAPKVDSWTEDGPPGEEYTFYQVACFGPCDASPAVCGGEEAEAVQQWNTRADGWMGIESAPRDGSRVTVFVPPYGAMAGHNNFHLFGGQKDDIWHCHSCLNKEAQPTHWMPLPTPPKVDE